eukprot:5076321-Amphidinium_carterae.3
MEAQGSQNGAQTTALRMVLLRFQGLPSRRHIWLVADNCLLGVAKLDLPSAPRMLRLSRTARSSIETKRTSASFGLSA